MRIDVRVQNHFVKNTSKKTALKQNTFVRVFNHGFSDKTTQNVQKTIEKHRKSFWFTVSFYKTAFSYCLDGGQRWIRTTEVWDVRFTVWSIWPLWNLSVYGVAQAVEPVIGLEPTTCWLQISCSANWATPACGALRWNRTIDRGIFSPLLYQLSYQGIDFSACPPKNE